LRRGGETQHHHTDDVILSTAFVVLTRARLLAAAPVPTERACEHERRDA
jgi:hypothetical protein